MWFRRRRIYRPALHPARGPAPVMARRRCLRGRPVLLGLVAGVAATAILIQLIALANQVADLISLVQQARDLIERELEPAVNDDLGQARQVRRCVNPIARGATATRGQQPDFVIVVKRPDCDAKSLRDFAHGEFVHLHLLRHIGQGGA